MKSQPNGCHILTRVHMFLAFIYIIIVYCQTQFGMGQLCCHQMQSNYNWLKFFGKVMSPVV